MKRSILWTAALALTACVVRDNPRYRSYPEAPPPPPSPTQSEPRPLPKENPPKPVYDSPGDYPSAVRQLDALRGRIAELLEKDRLFEISSVSGHLSFVAANLPELIERDAVKKILEQVGSAGQALTDTGDALEHSSGGKEKAQSLNADILPQLETLKRFEPLSDDYEVQGVPRGCPSTFKRAITRISGVYNSILEKIQANQLAEIPDVARHLKQVAENLRRLAVNNIGYPIKSQVKEAADRLRDASDRAQSGAEREDKAKVRVEVSKMDEPIKILDLTWKQFSGKGALEPK